jgi:hypothetical protein
MFTRIVECEIKKDKLADLRHTLNNTVLPAIQKQPGFVDVIEACDPGTGQFQCMTLWKSRDDADRYGRELFPEHAQKLQSLINGEATVKTLAVETSSVHRIAAGKAA